MRQTNTGIHKQKIEAAANFENLLNTFFENNASKDFTDSLKKRFKEIPDNAIVANILIREEVRYDEGIVLLCKMHFTYVINNNKHKFEIHCHYTKTGKGVVSQHTTRWMNSKQSSESQFKRLFI